MINQLSVIDGSSSFNFRYLILIELGIIGWAAKNVYTPELSEQTINYKGQE